MGPLTEQLRKRKKECEIPNARKPHAARPYGSPIPLIAIADKGNLRVRKSEGQIPSRIDRRSHYAIQLNADKHKMSKESAKELLPFVYWKSPATLSL
jgi:hypothetical protein